MQFNNGLGDVSAKRNNRNLENHVTTFAKNKNTRGVFADNASCNLWKNGPDHVKANNCTKFHQITERLFSEVRLAIDKKRFVHYIEKWPRLSEG